ncbi:ThuA domain-containing protein [Blastococcus sp. SYSU D00820]
MQVVAFTGGHSFDRDAFAALLDSLPCTATWVEHPDAVDFVASGGLEDADASLHYDMPGVRPEATPPPPAYERALLARTRAGQGFVVLHHAIASWPAWPVWAELVGGRYLYRRGELRGVAWPDSGYRMAVPQEIRAVAPGHPVLDGLGAGLRVVDETYLCPVFEDEVTPLLRTDAPIDDRVHFSTEEALAGRLGSRGDWRHAPGSPLAAWTRTFERSRVVYVQPGDTAATLTDPAYQRLVANALAYVAGAGAGAAS